jgi:hypothetical protein
MQKIDLSNIVNTVEAIRLELHPELPAGFVAAVIAAEEQNPDDDVAATRSINLALANYIDAGEIR